MYNMKNLVVLCILVAAVKSQSSQCNPYTLRRFEHRLTLTRERFVQTVLSDSGEAVNGLWPNLEKVLDIAVNLFRSRIIRAQKASRDIMSSLKSGFNATLNVPEVHNFTQGICDDLTFPFPDTITVENQFIRFTKRMNRMLLVLCMDLGIPSSSGKTAQKIFKNQLNETKQNFVATAQMNATVALNNLVDTDLIEVLDTATTYFHAGILPAKTAAVDILQYLKEGLEATMHVQEISTFAQDMCTNGGFPFSAAINMEAEYTRFRDRINSKLRTRLCTPLGF